MPLFLDLSADSKTRLLWGNKAGPQLAGQSVDGKHELPNRALAVGADPDTDLWVISTTQLPKEILVLTPKDESTLQVDVRTSLVTVTIEGEQVIATGDLHVGDELCFGKVKFTLVDSEVTDAVEDDATLALDVPAK